MPAVNIDYFSNSITSKKCLDRMRVEATLEAQERLALAKKEWDSLPCDEEGATIQQSEEMDRFLEELDSELRQ